MTISARTRIIFNSIALLLFIASCQTDNVKNEESKSPVDSTAAKNEDSSVTAAPEAKNLGAQATLFEGYLDTLYIEKATFRQMIGRRLVLKPYINDDGQLTLFGWQTKADDSNDEYEPNNALRKLELKSGNKSPIAFGKKSILPGVILLRDDFLTVIRALGRPANSGMKYVVFCPAKDPIYPRQYIFNIVLTDYEPKPHELEIKSVKAITPVIVSANPSPPRNS